MKSTVAGDAEGLRPPVVMERLVRLADADRAFDLEYWDRIGPQGRLQAMGLLLTDPLVLCGRSAVAPRLQRSIESFQRGSG